MTRNPAASRTTVHRFSEKLALTIGLCLVVAPPVPAQSAKPKAAATKPGAKGPNLAEEEAKRGDWSRWRGPYGDGVSAETGLLTEWPTEGPPLVWTAKGLGDGFASVSVADGKIFTLGQKNGRGMIHCLSLADGKPVWSSPLGGGEPNCTPTVDGDRVYALSRDGVLGCFQVSDGKEVWTRDYGKDFGAPGVPTWGYSESPLIDGEHPLCTPGGDKALIACLNKLTGETIWTTQWDPSVARKGHNGAGYSSIVISNAGGVKQYVTLVGKGVVSVDAANGKLLWGYNEVANGTACIPTPIVAGDYVFCSSGYGDGGTALLKINKVGKGLEPKEMYFLPANKTQNHHGGMIRLGRNVYMGHGHNNGFPLSLDMETGKDNWRPGRGPGKESAAIAYADGHLYFRYQDGTMALIEANPKDYKLKSSFKLASVKRESWPHPVIAGGKLYVRDQDVLLCYDVKKK